MSARFHQKCGEVNFQATLVDPAAQGRSLRLRQAALSIDDQDMVRATTQPMDSNVQRHAEEALEDLPGKIKTNAGRKVDRKEGQKQSSTKNYTEVFTCTPTRTTRLKTLPT